MKLIFKKPYEHSENIEVILDNAFQVKVGELSQELSDYVFVGNECWLEAKELQQIARKINRLNKEFKG